ncbi:MAG: IgGFc-binding protein [Nannocystis sp.]|nr:IgGFc-binding protein [Nannocystis sp.]
MTLARLVPVLALATACADDGRASETSLASTTLAASTSTSDLPTSDPATSTPTSSASTTADPTTAATTTTATTDPLTSSSSGATTCAGPDCDMCQDGETRCSGEVSEICDAGQWLEFELCDPLQGLSCGAQGVCEGSCAAAKLGQSYIGCDFYPTVTSQHDDYNQDPHVFAVTIANTTDIAAKVTITRGDVDVAMTTVDPGSVEAVTLPWVTELSEGPGPSALVIDGAYRLRSDQPVTVYQYNPFAATVSNDASLLIPVNAWGKKIVVASSTEAFDYPSFYAVVAAHDLTTVTLTPSATGKTVLAGGGVMADGSGQLVLDRGDVLQVLTDSRRPHRHRRRRRQAGPGDRRQQVPVRPDQRVRLRPRRGVDLPGRHPRQDLRHRPAGAVSQRRPGEPADRPRHRQRGQHRPHLHPRPAGRQAARRRRRLRRAPRRHRQVRRQRRQAGPRLAIHGQLRQPPRHDPRRHPRAVARRLPRTRPAELGGQLRRYRRQGRHRRHGRRRRDPPAHRDPRHDLRLHPRQAIEPGRRQPPHHRQRQARDLDLRPPDRRQLLVPRRPRPRPHPARLISRPVRHPTEPPSRGRPRGSARPRRGFPRTAHCGDAMGAQLPPPGYW